MIQSQHDMDALITQASQGDRLALETLLLHFYGPLLEFIRATSLQAPSAGITAEDVLQVCMTEAFRSIHTVKPQGRDAFVGWLKVIAKTRFINMLEAHYAQKRGGGRIDAAHFAQTTATSILDLIADSDPSPSRNLRKKEAITAMEAAMAKMDRGPRQLLEMRFMQDMTSAQIAAQLGKSEGAVRTAIHRAVAELREQVLNEFGGYSSVS